ncbi:MAG: hypothetical protein M1833_007248 [Piccolia ochrophora]|nr:MAG: hypothetical protein M1833_007248 [Piccolia ochrophora]
MPKILSHTPAWLSRPSPGFELFSNLPSHEPFLDTGNSRFPRYRTLPGLSEKRESYGLSTELGPRRTIARRNTEIFVAVGTEIRWADVAYLKTSWEEGDRHRNHGRQRRRRNGGANRGDGEEDSDEPAKYRILKILKHSVAQNIRQLIISPSGEYMAIVTSHTVHLALLPDAAHLEASDLGDIRMKCFMLGPTVHVLSQSPIVSAMWHPLGATGNCLVTTTTDAEVRVWEVSMDDRSTFEKPTLTVDITKLAAASSYEDQLDVPNYRRNTGFSPDAPEMEVAAACFGGTASNGENAWASMTLWIAMSEGDVYALCPILPSKWKAPSTLIPSLSVSIVSKRDAISEDSSVPEYERQDCEREYTWISEIDHQEPSFPSSLDSKSGDAIYTRPTRPGAIPKLQGPFECSSTSEELGDISDALLSDIYVISANIDSDELMFGEEDDFAVLDFDRKGLSKGVVCLLDSRGTVRILLDIDGVEGKWLPTRKSRTKGSVSSDELPTLLTFETVTAFGATKFTENDTSWPTFSCDIHDPYSVFVNVGKDVTFLSMSTWVERMESELQQGGQQGTDVRLDVLLQSANTLRELVVDGTQDPEMTEEDQVRSSTSAIVLQDSDLGYFLLTAFARHPRAVQFDLPDNPTRLESPESTLYDSDPHISALIPSEPRPAFQPDDFLWQASPHPDTLRKLGPSSHHRNLSQEIRLSQSTLVHMSKAHEVLSTYTHRLGIAAAELFRQCERLQDEFKEQIQRANDIATKVDSITGDDVDDGSIGGDLGIMARCVGVRTRQESLTSRYEALRKRVARASGRELSEKERVWAADMDRLRALVLPPSSASSSAASDEDDEDEETHAEPTLWQRYQEVLPPSPPPSPHRKNQTDTKSKTKKTKSLLPPLLTETASLTKPTRSATPTGDDNAIDEPAHRVVPPDIRRAKVAQVMRLLEREAALVEATRGRLERLGVGG